MKQNNQRVRCCMCNKKTIMDDKQLNIKGFEQAGICPKCETKLCKDIDIRD